MNSKLSFQEKLPRKRFFADLKIGAKLGLGFGVLVALIFFSAVVSLISSSTATRQIKRTDDVLVPTALQASRAQADLLRMLADVRGYLALGDSDSLEHYQQTSQAFETDLSTLREYSPNLGSVGNARLEDLQNDYKEWGILPNRLFELRDDQLDREPAYNLLATKGVQYAGQVIIDINLMITQQSQREPTIENLALMGDMARFQGNFAAMLSALRGYVTTSNRIYRGEFEVNLVDNQNSWDRLFSQRDKMTPSQQDLLDKVSNNRQSFLEMPEKIFQILEGDRSREDLYLFTKQAVPITEKMNQSLDELVKDQQDALQAELSSGLRSLQTANQLINGSGIVALIVGLLMAFTSRHTIALPISRLTNVAEQIRSGDFEAQAIVESRDEIGVLAVTFNSMTAKLRDTLFQVRKEKKRADDLLEVVIPIGIELTTERNFNRLLEKMLIEAKTFCRADAGLLLLTTEQNSLRYAIVRNDTQKRYLGGATGDPISFVTLPLLNSNNEPNHSHLAAHITLTGETINIADLAKTEENFSAYRESFSQDLALAEYNIHSLLGIPLKGVEKDGVKKVNGILLMLNAQDPEQGNIIPFDSNLQQMMESFSTLAVAALEVYLREQVLRAEVAQLRIEIDQAKRQKQVGEIVESEFFRDLKSKVQSIRGRHKGGSENKEA